MTVRIQTQEEIEQAEQEAAQAVQMQNVQYQHTDYQDADRQQKEPASQASDHPGTVRNILPKVGRNDACPCGSGKKYKHCHGQIK